MEFNYSHTVNWNVLIQLFCTACRAHSLSLGTVRLVNTGVSVIEICGTKFTKRACWLG